MKESAARSFADGVIELQRTAGNQAVGAMLTRDADEKGAETKGTNFTLVLPDPLGVLPVDAFTMTGDYALTIVIPASAFSPALMDAAAKGKEFATAKLSSPHLEFQMSGVIISSVQLGSGSVSFTLNAATMTKERPKEPQGKVG